MVQIRPDPVVANLEQDFQKRYEPNFAWKSACSVFQSLTGLRGFWPMSAIDSSGNASDYSLLNHPMQYNGNPVYGYESLIPYIEMDGTGDFLRVADNADHDILGTETYIASAVRGLTMGGWWYVDTLSNNEVLINKRNAGNDGYSLRAMAVGTILAIYGNGVTQTYFVTTGTITAQTWVFVASRFVPSTTVDVWINSEKESVATAIAALNNSSAPLDIGNGAVVTGNDLDGKASMVFLCASALSDTIISAIFNQTRAMYGV